MLATAPGGHGTEFGTEIPTVSNPEEAIAFVKQRVVEGADFLKIVINGVRNAQTGMPTLDADTVHALVSAGHEADLMVLAHVESGDDVRLAPRGAPRPGCWRWLGVVSIATSLGRWSPHERSPDCAG